jgi:small subunit ribosomal protein S4
LARYNDSKCRICRREGTKLFLKGDRCFTDKCAYDRRPYAPGQHGRLRRKMSDYAVQLREKQKVRRMYGILEKQFRSYFHKADQMRGVTGTNLLVLLERRLDTVAYRAGFATSRIQARQLVTHGHFTVNGRRVNIPSYLVRVNDVVQLREKSRSIKSIANALDGNRHFMLPRWLDLDKNQFKVVFIEYPAREDIPVQANEQLIVELYSK